MEITEDEPEKEHNIKKVATDVLEVLEEAIGVASSPSLLWLVVLWNSSGGKGFDGYVVNT